MALAAAVPLLLVAAPAHSDEASIGVTWTVSDQESGAVVARVRNATATDLSGWEVTVPLDQPVTDVSGAISIQDSEHLTLSSNTVLPAGQDVPVQLVLDPLGTSVTSPSWCASPDGECTVGSESTPEAVESADGATSGDLVLNYRVGQDWGTGQSIVMSVTNNGSVATSTWQVEVGAVVHVTDMWGAENLSGGGAIRAANDESNGYLAPGETIEFGFDVAPGRNGEWLECRAVVDEIPSTCSVSASSSWATYPQLPSQWD